METPVVVPEVLESKGKRKLVMVTAADAPSARWADAAGVDLVLVGDSLAMVALGRPDTLSLTMDEAVHHARAVSGAVRRALVVADMPFGSFQVSEADAVRNACRLVAEGGAHAVKLEGPRGAEIRRIVAAGIPVIAHLGLTPQSLHSLGGYRVQGREVAAAVELLRQAVALATAGAFALVLEAVPAILGAAITRAVPIPTIGIGAGPGCDGQVLVYADLLGLDEGPRPRFVRRYAELGAEATRATAAFAADVRSGAYPLEAETYAAAPELEGALAAELGESATC
jgi:3-methyl-2-oxobutanoate hydroxymethyltransferase